MYILNFLIIPSAVSAGRERLLCEWVSWMVYRTLHSLPVHYPPSRYTSNRKLGECLETRL